MWSFGLLTAVLAIERSKLTLSIATIELSAIVLNLLAGIGFITSFEFFYTNYGFILTALNIIEVFVLLKGAAENGVMARISALCRAPDNRGARYRRYVQVSPIVVREEA